MKIKKVVAINMPEAFKKIKEELGEDAIILNSKEFHKGGFLGFFTKKQVEVIAAIDPAPPRIEKRVKEEKLPVPKSSFWFQEPPVPVVMKETSHPFPGQGPEELQSFIYQLESQEVSGKLREQISKELLKAWYKQDEKMDKIALFKEMVRIIREMVVHLPFGASLVNKKMINLIGPTGVGKTTTLAKLASKAVLEQHLKVALITTDTYRIAAIDQLKTYAQLLDIPLNVAYTGEDFQKAIQSFEDYDLILIDSAGRNYLDSAYVEELKTIYSFNEEMETYLVLSATSKHQDMEAIIEQFKTLPIHQLIITKVDETKSYGPILSVLVKYALGLSYITNGQNVPDDIYKATIEDLTLKIVGERK